MDPDGSIVNAPEARGRAVEVKLDATLCAKPAISDPPSNNAAATFSTASKMPPTAGLTAFTSVRPKGLQGRLSVIALLRIASHLR